MKKKEADFGILFRHWLKANPMETASFELKDTRGKDSFPFDAVEAHQIDYSVAIKGDKGILIRVQGVNGEPDYIYLRSCPAYIVIKYPSFFVLIPIEIFIEEKKISMRKSLTESRAKAIATTLVTLKNMAFDK